MRALEFFCTFVTRVHFSSLNYVFDKLKGASHKIKFPASYMNTETYIWLRHMMLNFELNFLHAL
jgi:hypothetical protein